MFPRQKKLMLYLLFTVNHVFLSLNYFKPTLENVFLYKGNICDENVCLESFASANVCVFRDILRHLAGFSPTI